MPDIWTLTLFTAAALALLITPGPAVLYIVARSIHQGRMAGVVSALGLATGTLFHIAGAAFGLSALLLSSALAFNVVKYLGAAYLIYLGIQKMLTPSVPDQEPIGLKRSLISTFRQGIIVNLLNPKTALFFFAFLPQFVRTSNGPVVLQIVILGTIFVVLGIVTDTLYAILSGAIAERLKESTGFLKSQRYFAGAVYIGLGVTTALTDTNRK